MKDTEDIRSASDWIDRHAGRRDNDREQCAMHEYLFSKNDNCLDVIKQTVRDEIKKIDHRFELIERKMDMFVTKWAIGIIMTIIIFLLTSMLGVGIWQLKTTLSMSTQITTFGVKQVGVLTFLEKLSPEHEKLMDHLEENNGG